MSKSIRLVTGKWSKIGAVLAIVGLLGLACSANGPQQSQEVVTTVHPLVIIDPAIDDIQHLLEGVVDGAEVVVLDASRDGVAQIAEHLNGRRDLSSVHIVANGDVGCVALGSTDLCLENLAEHAPQLQSWGGTLGAGEHSLPLLFYGCDVAAGQAGAAFVAQLQRLTGAQVIASDDATGSPALGGDWQLEVSTGPQSVPLAFSTQTLSSYGDILDGDFVWARRAGGASSHDEAVAIALDSVGNVYVTGYFYSADFDAGDGSSVVTNGSSDIFVAKWDKDGSFVWSRQIGGTGAERGRGIAVDGAGNVYVTGFFEGTVDFDPGPGTAEKTGTGSGREIFVLKLDTDGAFQWIQHIAGNGDSHWDEGMAIAVDSTGANVYVTGYFEGGPVDFDSGEGVSSLTSGGGEDVFILQLAASDGGFGWAAQGVGVGDHDDRGEGIAVDGAGDVYVTGFFMGQVGFGAADLIPQGKDAFVTKLSSGGAFEWAGQFGGASGSDYDEGKGIVVDSAGDVYVTGFFEGTADFDPSPLGTSNLTSAGLEDIFVAKLAPSGDYTWARRIGGLYTDQGRDIAVDGSGNVYVTGDFQGTVDFDPGSGSFKLASNGSGKDLFVVRLSGSGSFAWARRVGQSGTDRGQTIAVDSAGDDYIAGFFQNVNVDFDPGAGIAILDSAGGDDIFLLKLDAAPLTDLWIAKQAVRNNRESSGVITYTIAVNNGGPTAAPGAIVSDPIPAGVISFTWACAGSGGANCPDAGPTSGAIYETSDQFPAGGQLVYTIRATLVSSDTVITNTATVTTLNGLDDPQEENNSATNVSHPVYRVYFPIVASP